MAAGLLPRLPWRGRPTGRAAALLDNLDASQWWGSERIATAQARRLRRFLVDVGHHHPPLRDRFAEAGFRPELVGSSASLAGLPLVDSPDLDGSTPVESEIEAWQRAVQWRARGWWGVGPVDPVLTLADDGERLDATLDALLGRRPPRAVAADGEVLLHLARRAAERRLTPAEVPLRALFVPLASFSEDGRREVETILAAPVALYLDLPELGLIAHTCPEGGLHLCGDHLVVEVVKPTTGRPMKAGTEGEVVVTDTTRRTDPLVRCRVPAAGACR